MSIRVIVHGASGKMGQMVIGAICREPDITVVGGVDVKIEKVLNLPEGNGNIPCSSDLDNILRKTKPQVIVDFSTAKAVLPMVQIAASYGINVVSGTTGLTASNWQQIEELAKNNHFGVIVASNFAIGAVVMMHLAKVAAKYFDYAEIIEEHHNQKLDAPSGTALTTARMMAEARGKAFIEPEQKEASQLSRGLKTEGVTIHSVRLPGIVARQEVLFGAPGQTLSIVHDAISRECYMPGVMLAIRQVSQLQGLIVGLDKLLGL
jgi:4-hydroxy-tetrahydrodipicolinate reductase